MRTTLARLILIALLIAGLILTACDPDPEATGRREWHAQQTAIARQSIPQAQP